MGLGGSLQARIELDKLRKEEEELQRLVCQRAYELEWLRKNPKQPDL